MEQFDAVDAHWKGQDVRDTSMESENEQMKMDYNESLNARMGTRRAWTRDGKSSVDETVVLPGLCLLVGFPRSQLETHGSELPESLRVALDVRTLAANIGSVPESLRVCGPWWHMAIGLAEEGDESEELGLTLL